MSSSLMCLYKTLRRGTIESKSEVNKSKAIDIVKTYIIRLDVCVGESQLVNCLKATYSAEQEETTQILTHLSR